MTAKADVPAAFYVPVGDHCFQSTPHTAGPWTPKLQHGGPPSALMVRAMELKAKEAGMPFLCRFTASFHRPIPTGSTLFVEAVIVRAGNKAMHLTGTVSTEGRKPGERVVVLHAQAVALKGGAVADVPPNPSPRVTPQRDLASSPPFGFEGISNREYGCNAAMEKKLAAGVHHQGATEVWARQKYPLVLGEAPSPMQRTLLWGDSAQGISFFVPFERFTFVNADITVNVVRPIQGEWICLKARTDLGPSHGAGLCSAEIFDENGFCGLLAQQQVLESRSKL